MDHQILRHGEGGTDSLVGRTQALLDATDSSVGFCGMCSQPIHYGEESEQYEGGLAHADCYFGKIDEISDSNPIPGGPRRLR